MRVWIDVTNSPHVRLLPAARRASRGARRARSRSPPATSPRRSSSSSDAGLEHTVVGPPHGGASRLAKARAMAGACGAPRVRARPRLRPRPLARLARAATRGAVARRPVRVRVRLRVRARQHGLGCLAATRVVVPEVIPQERLDAPRRARAEGRPLPGAEGGVLPPRLRARPVRPRPRSGSIAARVLVVVRTPPDVSLYHGHGESALRGVLERLGDDGRPGRRPARTAAQREAIRAVARRLWSSPTVRSTRSASSRSRTSSSRQVAR